MLGLLRKVRSFSRLPAPARREYLRDALGGLSKKDPGLEASMRETVAWIGRAQDNSTTRDGGVARHYNLTSGWGASYPETTGYIVPTMLEYAGLFRDEDARGRAKRMLDWLVSIQFPEGGFQGGMVNEQPVVPVTFNTGQILLGLAAGVKAFGDYRDAMIKAADWLVATQESDGAWRAHPSPFAAPGEKAYETHVAWGLFEAARLEPGKRYADAALRNVKWALGAQRDTGWFDKCCLELPAQPLTHTLGYVLRGILEAYRFTNDGTLLAAAGKMADGLTPAVRSDGFLPGRLDRSWRGTVPWACLTGSVQIAACLLVLFEATGDPRYRDTAFALNRYVRRTVRIDGPPETRGAVKGSFPVYGGYGTYQYLNWAAKFFIDSMLKEQAVRKGA